MSLSKAFNAVVLWVRSHKAGIGALLGFIAAGLEGTGRKQAGAIVAAGAAWLIGGGVHASDAAVKEFKAEAK